MPFDTKVISVYEAEALMANASWLERYLIGVAYGGFARPYVSASYDVLDQGVASYDMQHVRERLNTELRKLGFNKNVIVQDGIGSMVKSLRQILYESPRRLNALDWLIGNENLAYWEEAKLQEAWKLDDENLIAFCTTVSVKNKNNE